jgi:myosin heavy subunit
MLEDFDNKPSPGSGSAKRPLPASPGPSALVRTMTNSNKTTLCQIFRKELQALMDLLSSSERHYVRCIKPNNELKHSCFKPDKVLEQLRSNGVMETVHLRKAGYASKYTDENFYLRYAGLGISNNSKGAIERFLSQLLPKNEWCIGNTKIFLKTVGIQRLEDTRKQRLTKQVIMIQRYIRRFNAQKKLLNYIFEAIRIRKEAEEKRQAEQERLRKLREEKLRKEEEERKRKESESLKKKKKKVNKIHLYNIEIIIYQPLNKRSATLSLAV